MRVNSNFRTKFIRVKVLKNRFEKYLNIINFMVLGGVIKNLL